MSILKTHKGDDKCPLFVNKHLFWWSASITLENNNAVLTDLWPFFSLYTLLNMSVSQYFYLFDHYAACCVLLTLWV